MMNKKLKPLVNLLIVFMLLSPISVNNISAEDDIYILMIQMLQLKPILIQKIFKLLIMS